MLSKTYVEPVLDIVLFEMLTLIPFGMSLDLFCFSFCSWVDVISLVFVYQTCVHQLNKIPNLFVITLTCVTHLVTHYSMKPF